MKLSTGNLSILFQVSPIYFEWSPFTLSDPHLLWVIPMYFEWSPPTDIYCDILFGALSFRSSPCLPGILPDIMHICYLACTVDVITSCLLDWSDSASLFFNGSSREKRLTQLWENYRSWCEFQGYDLADRASRKLFSTSALKPEAGKYVEVSQKTLSATAARYMAFWVASVSKKIAEWTGADPDMLLGEISVFLLRKFWDYD